MGHIKRYNAPKTWKIARKAGTFVVRPDAGGHSQGDSIALGVVLRDLLKVADNLREARTILNQRQVKVNGLIETEEKMPVGAMDIIEFPASKKAYRMTLTTKGYLTTEEIKDASFRYCRIENKTTIQKGKTQLNLSGGVNIIIDKNAYNVGDTLKLATADKKILGTIERKKGSTMFISGGGHVGQTAVLESIDENVQPREAILKLEGGEEFRTRVQYIFPIEKSGATTKSSERSARASEPKLQARAAQTDSRLSDNSQSRSNGTKEVSSSEKPTE